MSTYATKQSFGGRRARVADLVVIAGARHDGQPGVCLHAGVVVAISGSRDLPYLQDLRTGQVRLACPSTGWTFVDSRAPKFIPVTELEEKTCAIMEAMPLGTWTWQQ